MRKHVSDWPPSREGRGGAGAATVVGSAAPAAGVAHFPPPGWPTKAQIDYAQAMIILGLLLLALPWVISTLLTRPGVLLAGAGRKVPGV